MLGVHQTASAVCFYQVGGITDSSGTIVWSDTFNFTAPAIVSPDQPTLLAMCVTAQPRPAASVVAHYWCHNTNRYGDQGTVMPLGFAVTDLTVHDNHQYAFDGVMHVGDIRCVAHARVVWNRHSGCGPSLTV